MLYRSVSLRRVSVVGTVLSSTPSYTINTQVSIVDLKDEKAGKEKKNVEKESSRRRFHLQILAKQLNDVVGQVSDFVKSIKKTPLKLNYFAQSPTLHSKTSAEWLAFYAQLWQVITVENALV